MAVGDELIYLITAPNLPDYDNPRARLFSGIRFCCLGFWAPSKFTIELKKIMLFPQGHSTAVKS